MADASADRIIRSREHKGENVTQDMQTRIQRMFLGDAVFALSFVAVLWIVVAFVFFNIIAIADDGAITAVLAIGGALVLLFNTAAIVAMISHYSHEKSFIYGLDIRHLDEMRAARARTSREDLGDAATVPAAGN